MIYFSISFFVMVNDLHGRVVWVEFLRFFLLRIGVFVFTLAIPIRDVA